MIFVSYFIEQLLVKGDKQLCSAYLELLFWKVEQWNVSMCTSSEMWAEKKVCCPGSDYRTYYNIIFINIGAAPKIQYLWISHVVYGLFCDPTGP